MIRDINLGNSWKILNETYPIRDITVFGKDIVYLLQNTNKTQKEIAKEIGCNPATVSRYNLGIDQAHRFENIKYPIRKKMKKGKIKADEEE